jgi:hypothetical protein
MPLQIRNALALSDSIREFLEVAEPFGSILPVHVSCTHYKLTAYDFTRRKSAALSRDPEICGASGARTVPLQRRSRPAACRSGRSISRHPAVGRAAVPLRIDRPRLAATRHLPGCRLHNQVANRIIRRSLRSCRVPLCSARIPTPSRIPTDFQSIGHRAGEA